MDKLRIISLAAALGLAGAVSAQTQNTPDQTRDQSSPTQPSTVPSGDPSSSSTGTTDPSSASSPHQRQATSAESATEEPPVDTTDPRGATSPHQKESMRTAESPGMAASEAGAPQMIGLEVITPAGEQLGSVVDIVTDPTGAPSYIVIQSAGKNTVMPYSTAASMVHDNAVVLDQQRLAQAPKVDKGEWKGSSSKSWRTESDQYWNRGQGGMRTATPKDERKPKERG